MLSRVRSKSRHGGGGTGTRQWKLGAALLVLLVAFGLGVVTGRTGTPATPGPEAQAGRWPGPGREVNGVPVGYERTPAGAVTAALNYTALLGNKANIDPSWGQRAYEVFALQEVRDDLLARSRAFANTVADASALAADASLVLRAAPLGYRLDRYTDDEAVVSVWAVATGVGTPQLPMTTAWGTERLTLRWVNGDWRVAAITSESGPRPPDGSVDPEIAEQMTAFTPPRYHGPGEGR